MVAETDVALASFEAKRAATHPEFPLALGFVDVAQRRAQAAFACLVGELEHAAFAIREAEPATVKLQWWAEEFARAGRGEARHPLTRVLAESDRFARVPIALWYRIVGGALAQRDPEPAPERTVLFATYAHLYTPVAAAEAELFTHVDAAASATALGRARALRESAGLGDALRDGRLPLPLDLLARHRLSRGDLAQPSALRREALREWLAALAVELAALGRARLGVIGATGAAADRVRAIRASRAEDPVDELKRSLASVPMRAAWSGWRAARRSRG